MKKRPNWDLIIALFALFFAGLGLLISYGSDQRSKDNSIKIEQSKKIETTIAAIYKLGTDAMILKQSRLFSMTDYLLEGKKFADISKKIYQNTNLVSCKNLINRDLQSVTEIYKSIWLEWQIDVCRRVENF